MSETTKPDPAAKISVILNLSYPDGSQIQLTMTKPPGFAELSSEQAETTMHRMATRLLSVALEDLASQRKDGRA